jgi:hypothetical protein
MVYNVSCSSGYPWYQVLVVWWLFSSFLEFVFLTLFSYM